MTFRLVALWSFLFVWSLVIFIESLIKDIKKPKSTGYRFSNIPSSLNLCELFILFLAEVILKLSLMPTTILAIVQFAIGMHSLVLEFKHRPPYWFNWI